MKLSTVKSATQLSLSGSLDIYDAEEARQTILGHLETEPELVLDLAGIDACDAAGAQLLCATVKSASQAGKSLRFATVSPAVRECWTALGLSADLLGNSSR